MVPSSLYRRRTREVTRIGFPPIARTSSTYASCWPDRWSGDRFRVQAPCLARRCGRTGSGSAGPSSRARRRASSMKLFELRPLAAVLMTSTPPVARCLKPEPQPESSVTVESPTRTMRTVGAARWPEPCAAGAADTPLITSARAIDGGDSSTPRGYLRVQREVRSPERLVADILYLKPTTCGSCRRSSSG